MGDFNLDPTKNDAEGRKFRSFLTQYDLMVTNSIATRPQSGKIIDHFTFNFCDKIEVSNHTIEMDPTYTDHSMIISKINIKVKNPQKKQQVEKRVIDFKALPEKFNLSSEEIKKLKHPNDIAIAINNAINETIR